LTEKAIKLWFMSPQISLFVAATLLCLARSFLLRASNPGENNLTVSRTRSRLKRGHRVSPFRFSASSGNCRLQPAAKRSFKWHGVVLSPLLP
jgi:phosphate/sulfate permease